MTRPKTTAWLVLVLAAFGCCNKDDAPTPSPERLFNEAQLAAESGGLFGTRDCFAAERKVEELRRRYPYHSATLDGELVLAQCAFEDGRTMEAIGRWEAFLRFHRDNQQAVGVWHDLAMAYQSLYDDYDRDLGTVKQALHASSTVIRQFPETETAHAAVDIRAWARGVLAKREYYVARQYKRGRDLLSARKRLEQLISLYPETEIVADAQADLERINQRLNFPDPPAP